MRVYSTPGQFLSRLEGLDEPILARLSSCGLDGFKRSLEATSGTEGSHVLVASLMEWWWDTTNSFHHNKEIAFGRPSFTDRYWSVNLITDR